MPFKYSKNYAFTMKIIHAWYLILPFLPVLQHLCKFADTAISLNKIYYTQHTWQYVDINTLTLVTRNRTLNRTTNIDAYFIGNSNCILNRIPRLEAWNFVVGAFYHYIFFVFCLFPACSSDRDSTYGISSSQVDISWRKLVKGWNSGRKRGIIVRCIVHGTR